jgi:phosphoribosylaminoimidazolecarboxamide formyltransferase/IMP cyclohydrolase
MLVKITRALISVSNKEKLEKIAKFLDQAGVEIISTGNTALSLQQMGIKTIPIQDYTSFPEILDGRVKTLHPKIYGGILSCADNPAHQSQMQEHGLPSIDLVIVNLYPFTETVKKNAPLEECIENIDIGGPSMIRATAKNYHYKTIITDSQDYEALITEINANDGRVSEEFRKKCALKAFAETAKYDSAIAEYFSRQGEEFPMTNSLSLTLKQTLRYGENSHQKAALYSRSSSYSPIIDAVQLNGKELSYNNISDADAAWSLVCEFALPTVAIIKHSNPCGVGSASSALEAYKLAFKSDPVSAFGSIIALNTELDAATAQEIQNLFVEVIIAPQVSEEARAILCTKKNLRILVAPKSNNLYDRFMYKSIQGGMLIQENDIIDIKPENLTVVTTKAPTPEQLKDMLFAFKVCKHVKSNAIVLASNQATIGIGAGQMSRIDSVKIAILKATETPLNFADLKRSVLASDAFFPFPDSIVMAAEAGVEAIIQPGGSIQDKEVIRVANEREIAMVFTGSRHFKH